MRFGRLLGLVAMVPLVGCVMTSGQFAISLALTDPIDVAGPASVIGLPIDLNTISEYADHKDNLSTIADAALVGEVENTGAALVNIEFWMTPDPTSHVTAAQVLADPNAVRLWGPLAVAPGTSERMSWNASAGLFSGRQALLNEVKGDGAFTLYAIGTSSGSYAFRLHQGVLVLVLDAGI